MIDLQPLIAAPIIEQYTYPAAYPDHTNDVWCVRTATETVVVRAPRPAAEWDHAASPFWRGCRHLFGLDPTDPDRIAATNALLNRLSPLPIPRVLRSGIIGERQYVVVAHLPGEPLDNLCTLPAAALHEFGAAIARHPYAALPLVRHARWQHPTTTDHLPRPPRRYPTPPGNRAP